MLRRHNPSNMMMQFVMFDIFWNPIYIITLWHRAVCRADSILLIENYMRVKSKTRATCWLIDTIRTADAAAAESIKDDDAICHV